MLLLKRPASPPLSSQNVSRRESSMPQTPTPEPFWMRGAFWASVVLLLAAVAGSVTLVVVAADRELSSLETTLLQVLILAAGLSGSYLFGQQSAKSAARELMKPAARSAFRRVLGLYASLGRLAETLNRFSETAGSTDRHIEVVRALVTEQQASVSDAMEDWRDLVPEDVADVERRLENQNAIIGDANQ
jgi:hypothetical protein